MKKVLTIAGSDSSGGAGIQADIKTFSAHGVYGMSVITAVTAQNTRGVFGVQDIDDEIIARQIDAVFQDIEVDALKIGMVSQINTIKVIAAKLKAYRPPNIVLDPVMVAKSGYHLLNPAAKETLTAELLPLATIATPNIPEAEVITKTNIADQGDMEKACARIHAMGPQYILVKGGHLPDVSTDILFDGKNFTYFTSRKINTKNTHGTGCTLSAAIAANLGKGDAVPEAVRKAKEYITGAIEHALPIGKGAGPTNHLYLLYRKGGIFHED